MTKRKFEVKPLFAVPYFVSNISDAITAEQVKFLKSLKMRDNQVNQISENLSVFDAPELKSVAKAVQQALDSYADEVMGISQRLKVTQSWTLVNAPGIGMHGHSHSNSIVSGSLYYTDLPTPPGTMIFERFSSYQQIELAPNNDNVNVYNTVRNAVIPKKGDLLLFPSRLQHYVEENQSTQTRYSLAFNSFVRGKIGSFKDVSELKL